MDSFMFGEADEEKPAVPDSVLQNLLLKVRHCHLLKDVLIHQITPLSSYM